MKMNIEVSGESFPVTKEMLSAGMDAAKKYHQNTKCVMTGILATVATTAVKEAIASDDSIAGIPVWLKKKSGRKTNPELQETFLPLHKWFKKELSTYEFGAVRTGSSQKKLVA